jgi:hypothetical protein
MYKTGKVDRLGKQHNAPTVTHLPSYCIFRLTELSFAQFDYLHCAEIKVSAGDSNLDYIFYETNALTYRPT